MGLFTPFAYIKNKVSALPTFNPNDLANLTFWIDFSNSNFYTTSGTDITEVYSKVGGVTSHTLNRVNVSNNFYTLADSLSNSALKTAKVVTRPTTYRASSWNTANNDAIVFGPKTDTTSNPDGTMFTVYNRGTISTAGYLISRYTGTVDRGVQYNLSTGTPQTDIIGYDQNSPAYQYYNTDNAANVILTRVNNGATSTIYTNGELQASGAKNDTQNRTTRQFHNLGLFGSPTAVGETTPVNTQYCEVIIYNRVLTDAERTQVLEYLSAKWNIPLKTQSVVTNGLMMYLDAGNLNSYPGSGTTWTDLSGNGRNVTLVNGPTFTTTNGGGLVFDGTNDQLSSVSLANPNGRLTFQILFNYTAKNAYQNIFDRSLNNPMMWIDASNRFEFNQAALVSSLAYNGQNILATGTFSTATPGLQLYINDSLTRTTNTAQASWPNPFTVTLFNRGGLQTLQGTVYAIRVYDRVLSQSEIAQNYNFDLQRFS